MWRINMPCYDGREDEDRKERVRQLMKVEATLCGIFSALIKRDINPFDVIDWSEVGVSRREAEEWWQHHKELDKERKAREARLSPRK
jgi:hypothetical protein